MLTASPITSVQERWAKRNADLMPETPEGKSSKQGEPVDRARRFLAFSTGPRQCIGQSLARMLHDVAIAMLFGRFTFQLAARVRWLLKDMPRWSCALPEFCPPGTATTCIPSCHR